MADKVENCDMSIIQKLPALPDGKSLHFFVSYSCEERVKVIDYCDELESRFPVKCFYSDRDFQAGKDIAVNIKEGMAMSLKVLLFISPSFLQSGWCKYETDAAFVTSMGCGYSCIVPVLIEECEIPPTLVTLTYIDGTIPGVDIPAKIASSLLRPNTDDGILGLNMRSWNKIYENGYSYMINAEREPLMSIRPAKYKFTIKQSVMDRLELNKVKMPRSILKKAFRVINNHSVMWSFDFFKRLKNFLWLFLLGPFMCILFGLITTSCTLAFSTRNNTRNTGMTLMRNFIVPFLYMIFPVLFVTIQLCACCIPNLCHRKKRDLSLHTRLWEVTGKDCMRNNVLLLYSSRKLKLPTVMVMRYNIARCREYFIGILQSRNLSFIYNDMTVEKYADIRIERLLAEWTKILADDFESLSDAPSNRHNVKGGKICICQQLEQDLI